MTGHSVLSRTVLQRRQDRCRGHATAPASATCPADSSCFSSSCSSCSSSRRTYSAFLPVFGENPTPPIPPPPIDSNGKHACLQRRRSERRRQEPPPDPVSRQTVPPLWRRAETAHPPAPLPFRNTSSSSSSSSTCRRLYTKKGSCLCPAATPDRKGQDTSALCSSWSGTESRLGCPGPLNRVSISCFPPALSSCGTGSKAEQPAQKGTQPRGRGER